MVMTTPSPITNTVLSRLANLIAAGSVENAQKLRTKATLGNDNVQVPSHIETANKFTDNRNNVVAFAKPKAMPNTFERVQTFNNNTLSALAQNGLSKGHSTEFASNIEMTKQKPAPMGLKPLDKNFS